MYTFESRVRYSETDINGELSPVGVINYFQDCSTFQSEDIGVGVKWLEEKKRSWLLSSWRIIIDRLPRLGEYITVGTFPYGFKSIYGYRNFYIADESNDLIVRADSVWFLYDVVTGAPQKVTEEHMAPYVTEKLDLGMGDRGRRKIILPPNAREAENVEVRRHHIDTNRHMNNAQYVAVAAELSGVNNRDIMEIRVEYRKAARLGDILHPLIADDADGKTIALSDGEGSNYAVVRLMLRQ